MRTHAAIIALSLVVSIGLAGCSDSKDDTGTDSGAVTVTLSDFRIELASSTAPAGEVTFEVANDGPSVHEFVVFQTDLASDALPTDENGDVAEGEGFEPVDEIEDIASDTDSTLTVDLTAGDYVVICNLPGHYRQGMHAAFTVT